MLVERSPGKERLTTYSCRYTVQGLAGTATVEGFLTPSR